MALPKRMELEDATPQKPMREMTDAELNAVLWKSYRELEITEQDVAKAAARRESAEREANGDRLIMRNGRWEERLNGALNLS